LDLEQEIRSLQDVFEAVQYREQVDFAVVHAVQPDDLVRVLRKDKPAVVHFSGHGTPDGILLRDGGQGFITVPGKALEQLFQSRGAQLVVLNACWTQDQASAIASVGATVVGTSAEVGDEAARRFSAAFYRTLGNGHTVADAFKDGRDAVAVYGFKDVFKSFGDLHVRLFGSKRTHSLKFYLEGIKTKEV
jgi:CHAT domain-containing protein